MEYVFSDKISGLKPSAIREILKFTSDPAVIPFAAGNPSTEAFPVQTIAEITNGILTENPIAALQYSVTEGYPPLVDALKALCKSRYGIGSEADELIVTSGAQQGIELSCKALCNEHDTILCENPSFIGSLNSFRSYNVNLVGVEVEQDGISIEKLEKAMQENPNAKLLYLIPNFQNPSGITMSLAKRKAVYALAKQYGILILEDNPYGELRFAGEDIPSIKSMDTEGIVIYVGSFSKVLSPGLRVGYVVAPKPIVAKITVCKQGADVHTAILPQMICERFLRTVNFDAHIAGLREIYRKKSGLMLGELDKELAGKVSYTRPQGGLFIWCTLPAGADMMGFCREAVQRKVAVVPGNAFTAKESDPTTSFRINFSTPSDEQIVRGVGILGALAREMF